MQMNSCSSAQVYFIVITDCSSYNLC